jgi:hypothetical protein
LSFKYKNKEHVAIDRSTSAPVFCCDLVVVLSQLSKAISFSMPLCASQLVGSFFPTWFFMDTLFLEPAASTHLFSFFGFTESVPWTTSAPLSGGISQYNPLWDPRPAFKYEESVCFHSLVPSTQSFLSSFLNLCFGQCSRAIIRWDFAIYNPFARGLPLNAKE